MTWSTQARQDKGGRKFIPYEIPLGPDDPSRARLVLPEDMTTEEAERICEVIRSLAFRDTGEQAS